MLNTFTVVCTLVMLIASSPIQFAAHELTRAELCVPDTDSLRSY